MAKAHPHLPRTQRKRKWQRSRRTATASRRPRRVTGTASRPQGRWASAASDPPVTSTTRRCWPRCSRSARATSPCACRSTSTGIDGKIADAFNDVIELNERMAHELERLSRVVGKEGKHLAARRHRRRSPARGSDSVNCGQRADQRPGAPDQRNGARDRRRGEGRPLADDGAGDRRPPARRRIPAHRQDRQHDGGAARLVRRRK